MKLLKFLAVAITMLVLAAGIAGAQTWTPLTHQPGVTLGPILQLRDGRILAHEEQDGNPRNWWILTPDSTGSYVNGTWSSGGQLPDNYSPFYFSTQVLLDGKRVIAEGGEYNFGSAAWTNIGAIGTISGSTFTWASNNPPSGWSNIGDAQSIILANGTYMQANCCTSQGELAAAGPPWSWTAATTGKSDWNDEEGWTLLPSGKVLTVDAYVRANLCGGNKASELYDPGTNAWTCGPNTPTQMWDSGGHELGPAILMYNAKVMQFGAVPSTAIYDPVANTWVAGPTPAGGLDAADAPAALEPNGKVLVMLSPGEFGSGCQMVEYDPVANTLANTTNPANCPSDSSFVGHLMVLPTGQIMFTDLSGRVEVYTPASGFAAGVKKPLIVKANTNNPMLATNNVLAGFYFNGLTQNNGYGDDYQGDTNYPLVRLTSYSTGHVFYATSHDDSTHSISPTAGMMTTMFDRPSGLPTGYYTTEVVANGITSSNHVVFFAP